MTTLSILLCALLLLFLILHFRKKKEQLISVQRELSIYKEVARNLDDIKCTKCESLLKNRQSGDQNVKINRKQAKELMQCIAGHMTSQESYLDSQFNMNKLSEGLGVNRTYLSYAINQECGIRFETYVNSFRIKAAIELLSSEKSNQYTLEYIALKVGFQSKSTFNRSFRQFTSVNPSFFVRKIKNDDAAFEFFISNFQQAVPFLY